MIEVHSNSLQEYELIKGTFDNIKQSVLSKIKRNTTWKFLDEFFSLLDYLTCFFNQISQTYHVLPNTIENKELFLNNLIKINRDLFEVNLIKFIEKVSKDDIIPLPKHDNKKAFSKSPINKPIFNHNSNQFMKINNDNKQTSRCDISFDKTTNSKLIKNVNKGIYKKNHNNNTNRNSNSNNNNNEGKIFKVQPFKDMKSKALVNKRSKMNVNINNCSNMNQNRSGSVHVGNDLHFKTMNNSREKDLFTINDETYTKDCVESINTFPNKEINIYIKPKTKEQNVKTLTPKKLNKRINNFSANDILCLSADKSTESKYKKIGNIPFKDDKIPSKVHICNTATETKPGEDEEIHSNNNNNSNSNNNNTNSIEVINSDIEN